MRDLMLALSEVFGRGEGHYMAIPRGEAAEWQRKVAAAAVHLDAALLRSEPSKGVKA